MTKIELVKFKDGQFGIRKTTGLFRKECEFKDLRSLSFWWRIDSEWMRHCKGTEEQAREMFTMRYDYGEVVE